MAVVAVVTLVGATVGWAVLAGDGGGAGDAPPPVEVVGLEEGLPELLAHVEAERGLRFREEPEVQALAPEAYADRVRTDFRDDLAEDRERLQQATDFYAALGLVDGDVDIVEVLEDYFSVGTLGFYDPEEDELVVRGEELTPGLRVTIVHELTHAIDDQWFDLHRPQYDDREDEVGFAFGAVSEGDATRIERLYVAGMDPDEREAYFAEQLANVPDLDLSAIPPVLLAEERFLYLEGQAFAETVATEGGNEAIDATFEDPPTTSEEVIEPDVYLDGQDATVPADPDAAGPVVDRGTAGQFVLDLLTTGEVGGEGGPEWSGDRYVQWREGDRRCVAVRWVGGEDLEAALASWAESTSPGEERAVEAEDGTVLLTGCLG